MPAPSEWTGKRQGKLLVIRRVDSRSDGQSMWECRCDCGALTTKSSGNLRQGTQSCSAGCGIAESNRRRARHGVAHGKEWRAWTAAKQRCLNGRHPQYPNYGGRGITMCVEWAKDFAKFYAHVGPAPGEGRNVSLDRIDNDGNYEPGNVRWASRVQQVGNRRVTRMVEVDGETMTATEACKRYGLPYSTIDARFRKGLRGAALIAPRQRVLNKNSC
jgi:hypothetical protein